ncbi:MAG: hypothetical protein P8X60_08850 [Robiginitalea sp.]|jgi:hypothetical protein
MKRNDPIESLFEELSGSFDVASPPEGHRERFLNRLDRANQQGNADGGTPWWRHLSIAASIALLLAASVFLFRPEPTLENQVAEISPEVSETSMYFAGLVSRQIEVLKEMSSPETEPLIEDTLLQLEKLESNYLNLEQDLIEGGNSKMILSAMIQNFQTRIDLLQDVMVRIEEVKQFKNENHENNVI